MAAPCSIRLLALAATGALASLENQGVGCWARCGHTGPCEFCGDTGACCKKGIVHAACAGTAGLSLWRHTCVAAAEFPPDPSHRGRILAALYALVVAIGVLGTTGVLCLLVAARDFEAAMNKQMKKFEVISMQELVKEFARPDKPEKKGDIIGNIIGGIIMAMFAPILAIVVYVMLMPFQICLYIVSLPVLIPVTLVEVTFSSARGAIAVSVLLGLHAAAISQLPWWTTAMSYVSLPSCALLLAIGGQLSFSR